MNILDLLRSDGSIVVNKKLAHKIGLNEAIIYSELVSLHKYWGDRGQLEEGTWFFCTIESLQEKTTLKKDTQNRAIGKLEKTWGLIETKRMGLPSKRYFRITNGILKLIENKISQNANTDNNGVSEGSDAEKQHSNQISQNAKTRESKKRILHEAKSETNNTNLNNTEINNTNKNHHPIIENFNQLQSDLLHEVIQEQKIDDDLQGKLFNRLQGKNFKHKIYILKALESAKNEVESNPVKQVRNVEVPDWLKPGFVATENGVLSEEEGAAFLESLNYKKSW